MRDSGDVAIFWDYENCPIPSSASGYDVVNEIRRIAQTLGSTTLFKAYLEVFEQTPLSRSLALRSELQSSGVSLIDCPHNGRKDVADKMILVDMLAHAIDNPAPSTIILISGDRDFAYAISVLRMRRYRVVLVTLPNAHASLISQASVCLDWNSDILGVAASGNRSSELSMKTAFVASPTVPRRPSHTTVPSLSLSPSEHSRSRSRDTEMADIDLVDYLRRQTLRKVDSRAAERMGSTLTPTNALTPLQSPHILETLPLKPDIAPTSRPSLPETNYEWRPAAPTRSNVKYTATAPVSPTIVPSYTFTRPHSAAEQVVPVYTHGQGSSVLSSAAPGIPDTTAVPPCAIPPAKEPAIVTPPIPPPATIPSSSAFVLQANHAPQQLSTVQMPALKVVPAQFKVLVQRLEYHRRKGFPRPFRSEIALEIVANDNMTYRKAGVEKFGQYIALAEKEGIVEIGVKDDGGTWMTLRPEWHGAIIIGQ
ncbi:NYN domain-containing protein [Crucibulum laeve]|uniref:NYN domain-containing protein n=1 Tax=Crucibulum laeve TaxID=68775 RepID=A0A5C3MCM2_9AGAR|nr:NYN domain-containing protein [Crucibulum laeve]